MSLIVAEERAIAEVCDITASFVLRKFFCMGVTYRGGGI